MRVTAGLFFTYSNLDPKNSGILTENHNICYHLIAFVSLPTTRFSANRYKQLKHNIAVSSYLPKLVLKYTP